MLSLSTVTSEVQAPSLVLKVILCLGSRWEMEMILVVLLLNRPPPSLLSIWAGFPSTRISASAISPRMISFTLKILIGVEAGITFVSFASSPALAD